MPDPSPEASPAETPAGTSPTPDVKPAESSTAASSGVKSSLEAVNAALAPKKTEESPTSTEQDSKEPDPKSTQPEAGDPSDEEEVKKLSEAAQHRIRELVGQRKTAEAEVGTLRQEVETLKPEAESFREITGYMRKHEITPDHLNNALAITAMMNAGDFATALPILESLVEQARKGAGEVLPQQLQEQVNLGYITEAHAKELQKARLNASQTEQRAMRERQMREASDRQTQVATLVQNAAVAADEWTTEQAAKDPDWNLKHDLVLQEMENRLHKGGQQNYPRDKKAARKLLDDSKKAVEERIGKLRPAPKTIVPPATGHGASPRSAAAPKSTLDALNRGLANASGG